MFCKELNIRSELCVYVVAFIGLILYMVYCGLKGKKESFAEIDSEEEEMEESISTYSEEEEDVKAPDMPPISVIPPDSYLLDDGGNGETGLHTNICSKACCSAQYPPPFNLKHDPYICKNKDKFVPNNMMCNNSWQDSGCLCLTKKQAAHLINRGGNIPY